MHHLTEAQWIAIAAHRLQHRWRSINPGQLDDLAADLWRDEQLRALEPANAVDKNGWLRSGPTTQRGGIERPGCRGLDGAMYAPPDGFESQQPTR